MSDVVDLVCRSREASTREEFDRRVAEQAAALRADIEDGRLDNERFTLGLELEVYAIDAEDRLARLPDSALTVCNKEIGVHNAELNTAPSAFDETGIVAQKRDLDERIEAAQAATAEADHRLALDAMWTIPPDGGTRAYLSALEERDGVVIASNMHRDVRYHALDNDVLDRLGSVSIDAPGASLQVPTVFLESLATSMQPHLLIPSTRELPRYHNAAIRTLGPVLALATNAPFLPADCYADRSSASGIDPRRAVEEAPHELRIGVFEAAMNVERPGKVGVPRDIDAPGEIADRLLEDRVSAPLLAEWIADAGAEHNETAAGEKSGTAGSESGSERERDVEPGSGSEFGYADRFWELDYKRGTYWRWVRTVFGGQMVRGACEEPSLRIEYRSLPTQPSVEDTLGLFCLVAGLLRGIIATDHPLLSLEWTAARRCFYDVTERGFDAEFAWVTADGERTTDPERVYGELFELARRGLREQGVSAVAAEAYLEPIEARWAARTAPSDWKRREVQERLAAGEALPSAIEGMQRAYFARVERGDSFAEWL